MTLAKKLTHAEEALGQLVSQFHDKPNLAAFLGTFTTQVQDLELALFSIMENTPLDVGEGVQLDGIGSIVGEERAGRIDDAYRGAILARISLNLASGTLEDVVALTRAILGDVEVEVVESHPAHFELTVNDPITPDPPAWLPSTVYALNDRASNFGLSYIVTTAGTSAASGGPTGTGTGIVDGSVVWSYLGLGVGARAAMLVLSGKPAGVRGLFSWHEDGTPFAFDGDPEGAGFDVGAFAQVLEF